MEPRARGARRRGALVALGLLLVAVVPAAAARLAAYAAMPNGETVVLEVASSVEERALGMMGRSEVPRGTGMLFLFPEPDRHAFWMKGCLVPLDIVWLDARGVVVHVGERLPPCRSEPCPFYAPPRPASQVIEVGAGEAARLGMKPGALVLVAPLRGEGRR